MSESPILSTGVCVDTLVLSCYGEYDSEQDVLINLYNAREKARDYDADLPMPKGRFTGWTIRPFGISSRGFSYVMMQDDVKVLVSHGSGETAPNMSIEVGSISCQSKYLPQLVQDVYELFTFDLQREVVSRGDLCRDVSLKLDPYVSSLINTRHWYWNRKIKTQHYFDGDDFTGIQLGKGNIVCRLYNKSYELDTKAELPKQQFYSEHWGLDFKENDVTRLEYQMRRQYFRTVGVDSLADFLDKKDEIWSYLTQKWAFFSDGIVDRSTGNSKADDWGYSPLWTFFLHSSPVVERVSPVKTVYSASERVLRMGLGCIMSYCLESTEEKAFDKFILEVMDTVEFVLEQSLNVYSWYAEEFKDEVKDRYFIRFKKYLNANGIQFPQALPDVPF